MGDVALFPYLSLDSRVRVGPWEIIPKGAFAEQDAVDADAFALARQHLALYSLPDERTAAQRCGCFARPTAVRVGETLERSALGSLHLAVLVGLLQMNPADDADNPGMTAVTSENADVYCHPIGVGRSLTVEM